MPLDVAFAVFIKFYGLDPLDMSWGRFHNLYGNIGKVNEEFRPKTQLEIDLMNREAEIEQWKREHPQ